MGGKIRGLGSTGDYGAWLTGGMCERDEPGFSMVGGCWVVEKEDGKRGNSLVGGRGWVVARLIAHGRTNICQLNLNYFQPALFWLLQSHLFFVSLFPYFLTVGSAGQAVTLSPDLLRCAAKPVILHWLYHSSTVRGLGSGGCHQNGGCLPVS
jgi:hypothetical protein